MTGKERATLEHLVDLLQGNKDISEADKILPPMTLIHLDNYKFKTGVEGWQTWVTFLKERGRVSNVGCTCTEIKENTDGTYTLMGEWTGEEQGKPVVSDPISATYRIHDGKIVEIWTTAKNYTFFFSITRYGAGFWLILLYLLFWRRFLQKRAQILRYSIEVDPNDAISTQSQQK